MECQYDSSSEMKLFDTLKIKEWVCQSVQNQCDTHDIHSRFSVSSCFTICFSWSGRGSNDERLVQYSRALLPPSGQLHSGSSYKILICTQKKPVIHTRTHTHTQKIIICQNHCAKSPFSGLNVASSKKYLNSPRKVHQGRHKAVQRGSQISQAFVSQWKT